MRKNDVTNTRLTLGTRGSKLALAQSEMLAAQLRVAHPGLAVELQIISTKGDRVLDVALSAVGDKGLFVKELEQALLDRGVDLCVHSCKDLPSQLPDGLTLAAFPERADPRDVLVAVDRGTGGPGDWGSANHAGAGQAVPSSPPPPFPLSMLSAGAIVGTSSLRRACQLRALRPDLDLRDVRGNVDTRLRKLADGQYDALVLAAAGLDRLGLTGGGDRLESDGVPFVAWRIPTGQMLPAVAQGILAVECRADDGATRALLAALDHGPSRAAALAERAFLRRLEGGCQVPIAAYATLEHGALTVRGLVGALDGATIVRGERAGDPAAAEVLGTALAEDLLAGGADAILAELASAKR